MAMKGPLAPWASGMEGRLEALGYTRRMVQVHLRFAGSFSKFLLRHGATASDVNPELIEEFVAACGRRTARGDRHRNGCRGWLTICAR